MAGAGGTIVVVIFAMFVLPKVMSILPDFDPLVCIICIFGFLALIQHLGFKVDGLPQAEGGASGRRQHQNRSRGAGGGGGGRERDGDGDGASSPKASAETLLKEAEKCLQQNNWGRVEELSRKVTDVDPENARAWELLATAQKWDGRRDEALATVKKAHELYEVESKVLQALAKDLAKSEEEGAGATAQECEAKAEKFFGKRQYDLAVELYSKAIDALGDSGDRDTALRVRRRRAECAQQLQDWSTCRQDATVLLEADPKDTRALLQRAAANEALEKFKAALEDARQLLALDPKSVAANRIMRGCQQALRD